VVQYNNFITGSRLTHLDLSRALSLTRLPRSPREDEVNPGSASQAAEALRSPDSLLRFCLICELSGPSCWRCSAVYAVGEALRWLIGLERKAKEAKAFYSLGRSDFDRAAARFHENQPDLCSDLVSYDQLNHGRPGDVHHDAHGQ